MTAKLHSYEDCPARPEIDNLKGWQQTQNGSLQRIEKKVDALMFRTMAAMGVLVMALVGAIITMLTAG